MGVVLGAGWSGARAPTMYLWRINYCQSCGICLGGGLLHSPWEAILALLFLPSCASVSFMNTSPMNALKPAKAPPPSAAGSPYCRGLPLFLEVRSMHSSALPRETHLPQGLLLSHAVWTLLHEAQARNALFIIFPFLFFSFVYGDSFVPSSNRLGLTSSCCSRGTFCKKEED